MAEVTSAEQDQWCEICAALRAALAKMVEQVPTMKPGKVALLCEALDTAMWLEAKAKGFDQAAAAYQSEMVRSAAYGG